MKVIIFDVSNASCSLLVCAKGNSLMIDCGSNSEKQCPVDYINFLRQNGRWLSNMRNFTNQHGESFPLTKLSITHIDSDHISNAEKVHKRLTPYLLHRRYIEKYPAELTESANSSYYAENLCRRYRDENIILPDWTFSQKTYCIPMRVLIAEEYFSLSSIKNNSSYVFLIEFNGFRILFSGDMEKEGWEWLIENDGDFRKDLSNGINILIASHHGHTSGYSQELIDLMGSPQLSILSKGAESGGETNVDSRYSVNSEGVPVIGLNEKKDTRKTLTTRRNGNIYLDISNNDNFNVFADRV